MMTADPRLVSNAKIIHKISYQRSDGIVAFWFESDLSAQFSLVWIKILICGLKYFLQPMILELISHTKTENDNNVAVGISNLNKVALLTF